MSHTRYIFKYCSYSDLLRHLALIMFIIFSLTPYVCKKQHTLAPIVWTPPKSCFKKCEKEKSLLYFSFVIILKKKLYWEQPFFPTNLLLTTKGSAPTALSKSTESFLMTLALKASPSETCFCPNFWFQAGVKPCHLVEIWVNTIKVEGNTHLYFENWSSIHKVHLVCLYLCVQNTPLKWNFSYGENPSFFFLKLEWWKVLYCTTGSSWK